MRIFTLIVLLLSATASHAGEMNKRHSHLISDGPHFINVAIGSFEGLDDRDNAFAGQIEVRSGKKLLHVGPLIGVLANADGGVLGFAGLYLDLQIGRFIVSPQTGIGLYEKGESKDLGGAFEFVSGLGISFRLGSGNRRIGFRYQHVSNADLHRKNPGADILLLTYGIPF